MVRDKALLEAIHGFQLTPLGRQHTMKKTQKKVRFSAQRIIDTMRDDVNMKKEIRKMKKEEKNPSKPEDKGSIGNAAKAAVAMLILLFALSAQADYTEKYNQLSEKQKVILQVCVGQRASNAQRAQDACNSKWANNPSEREACYSRMVDLVQSKFASCVSVGREP
jgi:hypothetical protein